MIIDLKRPAIFAPAKLRKLAPKYAYRKSESKRRMATIAVGLRNSAGELHVGAYSISVLTDVLNNGKTKKLPEWRYTDKTKTVMYQLAMGLIEAEQKGLYQDKERLRLIPFVFNLSTSIQKQLVDNKKNEVAACMKILSRGLTRALKRPIDLWFQLEMAPKANKGRPHIQGSILLADRECKKARQVFHKANGLVSSGFKNHALMFCTNARHRVACKNGLLYADINWSLYCAKESARTKILYTDQNQQMLTNIVAVSNTIRQSAKLLYEKLREAQASAST